MTGKRKLGASAPPRGEPCAGYRSAFLAPSVVEDYETLYRPGTQDSTIWALQQPYLRSVLDRELSRRRDPRALDFASGTGRLLPLLEENCEHVDALDVSPVMLDTARQRASRATFYVGDLTDDEAVCPHDYDVVTAFRFLLNADPLLRRKALKELHRRLVARSGIFIVNSHGNPISLRYFAMRLSRRNHRFRNELGHREMRRLLSESGFAIVERRGFGLFPSVAYRTPLRAFARAVDRAAARVRWLTPVSIDLVYVARAVDNGAAAP